MVREYKIICIDCGAKFIAHNNKALRCAKCKSEVANLMSKEHRIKVRMAKLRAARKPTKSINEVLKELAQYNKDHQTNLSYGQFIQLAEGGQSDGKK